MDHIRATAVSDLSDCWPALPFDSWRDTCDTLHMWTQIVGKVRLALTPRVNHWWNVPLYVSARGLTTSAIPYGSRIFEMEFDLVEHKLVIRTSDPATRTIALAPRTVADFYREVMAALRSLQIDVHIWNMPVEVADPVPFDRDTVHASYDPEYARRFWRILVSCDEVFQVFRSRFIGKSSPVHFFWGSFDLAVSRFSGRRAPARTDPDPVLRKIMQEAYSHEVISAGWWPGGGEVKDAAFYCYAAPEPQGFAAARVRPQAAGYQPKLGEFILSYDDVRREQSPTSALLDFLQSTYEAGATLGRWDREVLEQASGPAPRTA
ncbi:MAG TPA: DUF5996 family protein [Candidatus Limnocylindrales bacterium]|nr:DUF5996 family protein [Candidatus Limnocylindrales bacterium]